MKKCAEILIILIYFRGCQIHASCDS